MNLIDKQLKEEIVKAFKTLFDFELNASDFELQPTRKEFEGTHTLVVFPYLRQTKKGPEQSGEAIGEYLKEHSPIVSAYNVVKGFLNLSIAESAWVNVLQSIAAETSFGQYEPTGEKVMVEFSSPNTNKPLHLGHLRNNFLGRLFISQSINSSDST